MDELSPKAADWLDWAAKDTAAAYPHPRCSAVALELYRYALAHENMHQVALRAAYWTTVDGGHVERAIHRVRQHPVGDEMPTYEELLEEMWTS